MRLDSRRWKAYTHKRRYCIEAADFMDRLGEVMEQTLQQVKPAHKNSALLAAFPATVPVLTGYLCLGIAYGVLMRTAGYGLGWAVFLSIVC